MLASGTLPGGAWFRSGDGFDLHSRFLGHVEGVLSVFFSSVCPSVKLSFSNYMSVYWSEVEKVGASAKNTDLLPSKSAWITLRVPLEVPRRRP